MVAFVACAEPGAGTEEALMAYCQSNFAKAMRPEKFIVRKALPRLANGKVDIKEVEKIAREGSISKTVDSLGLMRSMAPSQLKAKHIADNVCAVSVMGMISFHTWQTAGSVFNERTHYHDYHDPCFESGWLRAIATDWREGAEWSTWGFVFAGAYLDAMAPERFTFGVREVVILYSYVAACLIHYPLAPRWGGQSMWYLLMLLMAKAILASCHKLQLPVEIQALIFLAMPFAEVICPTIQSMEAVGNPDIFAVNRMFLQRKLEPLTLYGLTFLLAPDLMKILITRVRFLSKSTSTLLCLFYLLCWSILVYASGLMGPVVKRFDVLSSSWFTFRDAITFVPVLCACLHFPDTVHFQWIAQNALGSYVSSCIFYATHAWKNQAVLWLGLSHGLGGGNVGAVAQLVAVICFTFFWVCVVGPATQWIMLAPVKAYLSAA
jgi:hypothetical protein